MTETRMKVRTQQRPTTRTLVKWAWRNNIISGNAESTHWMRYEDLAADKSRFS